MRAHADFTARCHPATLNTHTVLTRTNSGLLAVLSPTAERIHRQIASTSSGNNHAAFIQHNRIFFGCFQVAFKNEQLFRTLFFKPNNTVYTVLVFWSFLLTEQRNRLTALTAGEFSHPQASSVHTVSLEEASVRRMVKLLIAGLCNEHMDLRGHFVSLTFRPDSHHRVGTQRSIKKIVLGCDKEALKTTWCVHAINLFRSLTDLQRS